MPYELLSWDLKLPLFALVLARLAGMIAWQPVLSALAVPAHLRAIMILALAAMVTPLIQSPPAVPDTAAGLSLAMAGEAALGVLMGLAIAACLAGAQLGGLLIAQESGLAIGQIADPSSGEEESLLSSFYGQTALVVYMVVGGHRALLTACLDTFDCLPLLSDGGAMRLGADLLVKALTVASVTAIRIAAPAVLTLFLVNLAMGFIARTVPQLNVVTVGFSIKALVGFAVMAVALPSAMSAFVNALNISLEWLHELIGTV
jgi:flagellar biosynthetic protein FliR